MKKYAQFILLQRNHWDSGLNLSSLVKIKICQEWTILVDDAIVILAHDLQRHSRSACHQCSQSWGRVEVQLYHCATPKTLGCGQCLGKNRAQHNNIYSPHNIYIGLCYITIYSTIHIILEYIGFFSNSTFTCIMILVEDKLLCYSVTLHYIL